MTVGIYVIRNTCNDMMYIGSSANIEKRWRNHISALNSNRHDNSYLQRAWNKYGADAFQFQIYKICETEQRFEQEQSLLDVYWLKGNLYNLNAVARNPPNMTGRKQTQQHKEKITKSKIGKPHPHKGKPHTKETREYLSKIKSNPSDEFRKKQADGARGRKRSPESIKKQKQNVNRFYEVIFPNGQHQFVKGLVLFCQEHGLDIAAMSRVAKGTQPHSHGFKARKITKEEYEQAHLKGESCPHLAPERKRS